MHICAQKYLNINASKTILNAISAFYSFEIYIKTVHDAAISFSSLSTEAFSVFAAMKNN